MLIITISIILLLAGTFLFFLEKRNKEIINDNKNIKDEYYHKETFDLPIKSWKLLSLGTFLLIFGITNPFSINDAGNRQVLQTINGDLWVRFEPGLYLSGPFSKVTTWPNNFTIQVSREENKSKDADYWVKSDIKDGTFSEGDNAELEHTVKWDLPNNEKLMIDLHITYNNVENLMSTTLLSYQKKIASFSTQRMSSEAHYSGGKSQLDQYFQDQLRNGQVLLQTETKTRTLEDGSQETYISVKERLDENGQMKRVQSDIQQFGILSTYTSIDNVHYTPEIDEKLKQKIKYAADKANSKQELIAAQQEEQTAIVKGRKLIAETTAREEAKEQEAVIQARKERKVAEERLAQAKLDAEAELALKKAQAEGDRLKVIAGLSPREAADIDKETAIGVAKALAGPNGIQFPAMLITGGGDNGQVINPFDAVGLESFINISKSLTKKN